MKMDLCMKDNGNRIECVVMEKYIINQEIQHMKDIGIMIDFKVKEFFLIKNIINYRNHLIIKILIKYNNSGQDMRVFIF